MNEYIEYEIKNLRSKKSLLLAELGQSVYYQYRIGQLFSEELSEIGDKIVKLDQEIFQLQNKELDKQVQWCSCGNQIDENDYYCSSCGAEVQAEPKTNSINCQQCGIEVMYQASFCYVCGTRLTEQQEGVL